MFILLIVRYYHSIIVLVLLCYYYSIFYSSTSSSTLLIVLYYLSNYYSIIILLLWGIQDYVVSSTAHGQTPAPADSSPMQARGSGYVGRVARALDFAISSTPLILFY